MVDNRRKQNGERSRPGGVFCFQMLASGGCVTSLTFPDDRVARQVIFSKAMLTGLMQFSFVLSTSLFSETWVCCRARSHAHSGVDYNVRVVSQIAFVRRAFSLQKMTVARRLFPWLHVKPSTLVTASPVVIMCNTKGRDGPIVATGVSREGYQTSAHVLRWAASARIPVSQKATDSRSNS